MPEFQQLEQANIVLNQGMKSTHLFTPLLGSLLFVLFFPTFQRKRGRTGAKGLLSAFPYQVEMFSSVGVGTGSPAAQAAGSTRTLTAARWGLYTDGRCFHSLLLGPFHSSKNAEFLIYGSRKVHYLILQFKQTKMALLFSLKCTAQVSSKV